MKYKVKIVDLPLNEWVDLPGRIVSVEPQDGYADKYFVILEQES